jgi:hypothetical protein
MMFAELPTINITDIYKRYNEIRQLYFHILMSGHCILSDYFIINFRKCKNHLYSPFCVSAFLCVFVLLCLGIGLATGRSPGQNALQARLRNPEKATETHNEDEE